MPTVLRAGPYRFYFYSHEANEPPHIHIDRDELSAKFWLEPVGLARNYWILAQGAAADSENCQRTRRSILGGLEWASWRWRLTSASQT